MRPSGRRARRRLAPGGRTFQKPQLQKLMSADELAVRLSFRRLRASTSPKLAPKAVSRWKNEWLPSACPKFENHDGIGYCSVASGVCKVWECSAREPCSQECATQCMVLAPDLELIHDPPSEFDSAMETLELLENELASRLEPESVVRSLLGFAEECVCLAISGRPIEAIVAVQIHQWLHARYGDLRSFPSPTKSSGLDPQVEPLWKCMLAHWELKGMRDKLAEGDGVLVVRPEGRKLIETLPENPLAFVEEYLAKSEVQQEASFKLLWSSQMEPVVRWCHVNEYPVDFRGASLDEELFSALSAEQEEEPDQQLQWRQRLVLGFSFYNSLFSVLRFMAAKDDFVQEILNHYADLPRCLREDLGETIDHRLWLRAATRLYPYARNDEIPIEPKVLKLESHPAWPLTSSAGTLMASALLLGLGAKERKDILAKPHETGAWIEDVVADELSNMGIPIVARNVDVPSGEIDLICFDSTRYYVIEEKDYGPRGKAGYFSAAEYEARITEIDSYLNKFAKRVEWIRENPEAVGIPPTAAIEAVVVMSTNEPDVSPPKGIGLLNVRHLCGFFGGEPVDPLLGFEASERNDRENEAADPSGQTQSTRVPVDERALAVHKLLAEKFGSTQAFQIYKIAWESGRAIETGGVAVVELACVPIGRPPELTRQYVTFIAYKLDHIAVASTNDALSGLFDRGWLREENGVITIARDICTEYYRTSEGQAIPVKSEADADLILFLPFERNEEHGTVVGLADGYAVTNGEKYMLMIKELESE